MAGSGCSATTVRFVRRPAGYEPLVVGPRQLEPGQPDVRGRRRGSRLWSPIGSVTSGSAPTEGSIISNGEEWWHKLESQDGVPFERINCLHLAPGGDVWAGTPEGAWRLRDGRFRYFWGKRWLPDNDVQAIWTDTTGRAWIETKTGVACIEDRPITLAEKAAHYDRIIQERHNRRGYIAAIDLETPGETTKGVNFDVSDNDGLWTSLYVAAMALRFCATKAPAAREQARKSMNALLDLERLSGIPGFPARHGDRRRAQGRRPRVQPRRQGACAGRDGQGLVSLADDARPLVQGRHQQRRARRPLFRLVSLP